MKLKRRNVCVRVYMHAYTQAYTDTLIQDESRPSCLVYTLHICVDDMSPEYVKKVKKKKNSGMKKGISRKA